MSTTSQGRALEHLRLERAGPLAVLVLDRAPLNVLDIAMLEEVAAVAGELAGDASVAAVLVTGEGKAFSAGVDVADHTEDRVARMIEVLHGALSALMALPMPVVAAVNGAALGGGFELALACDVILAREGAKLGQPEVKLGVFPPFAAAILPRLAGRATALDLCLSGRTLRAEEALSLGLVQRVFPAEGFAEAARAYADEVAALSPAVLRLTKRVVVDGLEVPFERALGDAEARYLGELMSLEDAHEGLAAFLEKRQPVWKGA